MSQETFRAIYCSRYTQRRMVKWCLENHLDYWAYNKPEVCIVVEPTTAILLVGDFAGCSMRTVTVHDHNNPGE